MPSMNSRVKHIRDEDPKVQLRAPGLAAETASGNGVAIDLQNLVDAYWDNNEIPWSTIAAQLVVQNADFADTDETYVFDLEVGDDAAFTNSAVVGQASISAAGAYVLAFDADTAGALVGATHVRLNHTLAGSTPSVEFHAWLVHLPQAS